MWQLALLHALTLLQQLHSPTDVLKLTWTNLVSAHAGIDRNVTALATYPLQDAPAANHGH